jgi:hypothetical protein
MAEVLRSIPRHLRRYPGWYSLVAAWAVAMALLPVLNVKPVHARRATATPPSAARASDVAAVLVPSSPRGITAGSQVGAPLASAPTAAAPVPRSDAPAPPPPAPGADGLHLPQLPALPLPTPPAALDPVLQLAAPGTTTACNALGITRLGLDTLAPGSLGGVPVEDALAYLVPVYTACAVLPPPLTTTTCAVDDAVNAHEPRQFAGAYTLPPAAGLIVDEVVAANALLAPLGAPSIWLPFAAALTCDVHAGH